MSPKLLSPQSKFFSVGLGVGLGLLCMLGVGVVFGAEEVQAAASSITINMAFDGNSYVNIPPTAEGKFAATGTAKFSVTTNHATGYTLSATALALSYDDGETVHTIAPLANDTAITAEQFAASTGTSYTNKWGYLPVADEDNATASTFTNNDKYFPAPIETAQKLDETAIANPSTANEYDITIGARVDHTLEQGGYTTTIVLSAVGNPIPYTVKYYANVGSDTVTDMPGTPETDPSTGEQISTITKEAVGETDAIDNASPHRTTTANTAYLFAGWCTARTTLDGGCGGTKYNIASDYTVDQTSSSNTLSLYAMWRTDPCYNKTLLHDLVTCQVKTTGDGATNTLTERMQTLADMQAVIQTPVSDSPYADTSNSGVYKYDGRSTAEGGFGAANDNPDNTKNTEDVYYFRGILDNQFAESDTYGGIPSTGDSSYYQNYIRLSDTSNNRNSTCWRIIRTTATGGIKMIYNGAWTGSTCANARDNAATENTYYNREPSVTSNYYGTRGFVVYVGYNYNSNYKYKADAASDSNYTTATLNNILFSNNTSSNARLETEKWYTNTSNLIGYETNHKLETSAGWCNDRTTSVMQSASDSTVPYTTSDYNSTFGAAFRNSAAGKKLSLKCPNVTGYDLLTTDSNYIGQPLSLITSDESALAGTGFYHNNGSPTVTTTQSSNFSYTSFLRSGSSFWSLSPYNRQQSTQLDYVFIVAMTGYLGPSLVGEPLYLRPTISLTSSTTISSGSGTSTDPWVITP